MKRYLEAHFDSLISRNKLEVNVLGTGKPWVSDADHWNFKAGRAATKVNNESLDAPRILLSIPFFQKAIYNKDAELIREGGSIPVTLTFAENLKTAEGIPANVMLLPMGRGDDGAQ